VSMIEPAGMLLAELADFDERVAVREAAKTGPSRMPGASWTDRNCDQVTCVPPGGGVGGER